MAKNDRITEPLWHYGFERRDEHGNAVPWTEESYRKHLQRPDVQKALSEIPWDEDDDE